MSDKIRFNFEALDTMSKQCQEVQKQLEELANMSNKWASMMQNGALQGPPGEKFVEALGIFTKKVLMLSEKFAEEANDIQLAKTEIANADTSSGNKF